MDILTLDLQRQVQAPYEKTQQAIVKVFEGLGLTIDRIEGGTITAHRGSGVTPRLGQQTNGAIRARCLLVDFKDRVKLSVHLSDAEQFLIDVEKAKSRYQHLFVETVTSIDSALRSLDPAIGPTKLPTMQVDLSSSPVREQLGRALQGPAALLRKKDSPASDVRLRVLAQDEWVDLGPSEVQSLLTVARMAMTDPGIPQTLLEPVERLHDQLLRLPSSGRMKTARLSASEKRVFAFLYQQAAIRQALPIRELYTCRDCGQRKVVNPDYQKAASKNKNLQNVVGGLTTTLLLGPMGAFGLAGRLLTTRASGFVCAHCQGTRAEVCLITICPQCHRIQAQPVLRECETPDCGFAFMTLARESLAWRTHEEEHEEEAVPHSVSTEDLRLAEGAGDDAESRPTLSDAAAKGLDRVAQLINTKSSGRYAKHLDSGLSAIRRRMERGPSD